MKPGRGRRVAVAEVGTAVVAATAAVVAVDTVVAAGAAAAAGEAAGAAATTAKSVADRAAVAGSDSARGAQAVCRRSPSREARNPLRVSNIERAWGAGGFAAGARSAGGQEPFEGS